MHSSAGWDPARSHLAATPKPAAAIADLQNHHPRLRPADASARCQSGEPQLYNGYNRSIATANVTLATAFNGLTLDN